MEGGGGSGLAPNDGSGSAPNASVQEVSARSIHAKSDIAWEYVKEQVGIDGKKFYTCECCKKSFRGGGIHRMKLHLAGQKGDIASCKKVSLDVRHRMQESIREFQEAKKDQYLMNRREHEQNPLGQSVHRFEGDSHESPDTSTSGVGGTSNAVNRSRSLSGSSSFFPSGTTPGSQPTIKSAMQSKERWGQVDNLIARLFYETCIPINAINSIYFQQVVDAIACIGLGYKAPSYHALRTNLLENTKKEVQLLVDTFRSMWAECGCTLMGDGWKDNRQRSLINFLVYCPKGICFIKSVDASNMISDAKTLCNLFAEIAEIVGPRNIVHLVTDNAANYKAAGRLLNEKYPNILWTPCAAHWLNLILKDIGKLPQVKDLADRASLITIFVYNHKWTLSWLRQREGWIDILRPGETLFAITFISSQSLCEHKCDLQAMVTSNEFNAWNGCKTNKAKDVINQILDNKFWNDCSVIVKIVTPLVRLLRLVDSDERPALGYLYDGMIRATNAIRETFRHQRKYYEPSTKIVEDRWESQLRQDIHAATYWLNSAFQYDNDKFCHSPDVMSGLLSILSNTDIAGNSTKLMDEIALFRDRHGSFGQKVAQNTYKTTTSDAWWFLCGVSTPNLQKLAIRLLSQTASSSGCERNWSVFERVHSKRRNWLEHQRLNDLVFVQYNLRLQNRNAYKNNVVGPIGIECIDKVDSWVVEDETPPVPELNFEGLKNLISSDDEAQQGETENATNGSIYTSSF